MSAPLIALPAVLALQGKPNFDPISVGMDAFAEHAAAERQAVTAAYPERPDRRDVEAYIDKIAETAVLVCTATEASDGPVLQEAKPGKQAPTKLVGPGLAVRGIEAVLYHETAQRLEAADHRYGEQTTAKTFDTYTTVRRGGPRHALDTQGHEAPWEQLKSGIYVPIKRTVRARVTQVAEAADRTSTIEDAAEFAASVIVPLQIQAERELLEQTVERRHAYEKRHPFLTSRLARYF